MQSRGRGRAVWVLSALKMAEGATHGDRWAPQKLGKAGDGFPRGPQRSRPRHTLI